MQATRYRKANPKLKINTEVLGTAAAPEVVFKLIDDTEVSPPPPTHTHKKPNESACNYCAQMNNILSSFLSALSLSLFDLIQNRNVLIVDIIQRMKSFLTFICHWTI
jgi:hypothetical protein